MHSTIILHVFRVEAVCDKSAILDQLKTTLKVHSGVRKKVQRWPVGRSLLTPALVYDNTHQLTFVFVTFKLRSLFLPRESSNLDNFSFAEKRLWTSSILFRVAVDADGNIDWSEYYSRSFSDTRESFIILTFHRVRYPFCQCLVSRRGTRHTWLETVCNFDRYHHLRFFADFRWCDIEATQVSRQPSMHTWAFNVRDFRNTFFTVFSLLLEIHKHVRKIFQRTSTCERIRWQRNYG